MHLILYPDRAPSVYGLSDVMLAVLVLALSYPMGVGLNYLARFIGAANQRGAINLATDPTLKHIKDSFEAFFGIPADDSAWRYCYGIVVKHGYSVNVQLFAQLDIFCRSMMAGSGVVIAVTVASWITAPYRWAAVPLIATLVIASGSLVVFLFSARTYSRAFVGAIFEGFYSWLRDGQGKGAAPPGAP